VPHKANGDEDEHQVDIAAQHHILERNIARNMCEEYKA
jgi:hypothetical protein